MSKSIALITGGHRRVGKAISLELAKQGINIAFTYHQSEPAARETAREIEALGVTAKALACDLAQPEQISAMLDSLYRDFGQLDLLVNNASFYFPTPFGQIDCATWDAIFAVNLRAIFLLSQTVGLKMRQRGSGCIVNIGDWSLDHPNINYIPYTIAKAGLPTLTKSLAKFLAPQVRVNILHPGPVLLPDGSTPEYQELVKNSVPLGRVGSAQEVAKMVRFIFAEATFCTGAEFQVDGGRQLI